MPIKPKDSRLVGFNRVKPRLERLPKRPTIPQGIKLAEDATTGSRVSFNPPASSPNALVTPTLFLPQHLRQHTYSNNATSSRLPPPLTKPKEGTFLTPDQIEKIKDLRSSGVSLKEVARQFSTSTLFVSLVAPLSSARRRELKAQEDTQKANWSERRQVFAQIRQNKRATWGMA